MKIRNLSSILISLSLFFPFWGYAANNSASDTAKNTASADERIERAHHYFGDERLTDQDGVSHRFFSDLLSQHVVLINVIFTDCKDACPLQTQRLQLVREQLGDLFGSEYIFLSLSVDPDRDDPAALKTFAEKQHADFPGWRFLTADKTTMSTILGRLGQWTDDPNNHSTLLIAGNARNAHWVKLRPDSPPERIVADLKRLVSSKPGHF